MPALNQTQKEASTIFALGNHVSPRVGLAAADHHAAPVPDHGWARVRAAVVRRSHHGYPEQRSCAQGDANAHHWDRRRHRVDLDTSSLEAGGILMVEGDGTAIVKGNAGGAFFPGANARVHGVGRLHRPDQRRLNDRRAEVGLWYVPIDDGAHTSRRSNSIFAKELRDAPQQFIGLRNDPDGVTANDALRVMRDGAQSPACRTASISTRRFSGGCLTASRPRAASR
jgi:hypothetical protein